MQRSIGFILSKLAVVLFCQLHFVLSAYADSPKSRFDIGTVKRLEGESRNELLLQNIPPTPEEVRQLNKRETAEELKSQEKLEVERDLRESLR